MKYRFMKIKLRALSWILRRIEGLKPVLLNEYQRTHMQWLRRPPEPRVGPISRREYERRRRLHPSWGLRADGYRKRAACDFYARHKNNGCDI